MEHNERTLEGRERVLKQEEERVLGLQERAANVVGHAYAVNRTGTLQFSPVLRVKHIRLKRSSSSAIFFKYFLQFRLSSYDRYENVALL